nr:MAG TPA: hypothetical protein [Herelleviridae sp.]
MQSSLLRSGLPNSAGKSFTFCWYCFDLGILSGR